MTSANRHEKDSVLQLLLDTVNAYEDYELDITLNVHGTQVSGTMISAKKYLTELAQEFDENHEIEGNIHQQLQRANENLENSSYTEAHYIHLKYAKLYSETGASFPSKGSVSWRGRLSEIDGFFLGKVRES